MQGENGIVLEKFLVMSKAVYKILLVFTIFAASAFAQNPAKWTLSSDAKDKALKVGDTLSAKLTAEIESGWKLYSTEQPEGGPIATTIKVSEGKQFEVAGKINTTPAATSKVDPLFTGFDGKPLIQSSLRRPRHSPFRLKL